jgi:hypothetical protein
MSSVFGSAAMIIRSVIDRFIRYVKETRNNEHVPLACKETEHDDLPSCVDGFYFPRDRK